MTTTPALNYVAARNGRASAICCCCGRRSRPVVADNDGEPDLWRMPRGWSTAPYPANFQHADGSIGSTFHCPACNNLLRKGATLQLRAYLTQATGRAAA